MAETISFRQVGREVHGKICRGPVADAYQRVSQPSIPTRSEQVITVVEKRAGFGSTTDRFNYRPSVAMPGPADYVGSGPRNPSHSQKGYGGLTTAQGRFQRFQHISVAPGPGNYDPSLKNKPTSVKYVEGQSRSLTAKSCMPAPGDYEPKPLDYSKVPMTANFKSDSKKLPDPKNNTPSPWEYNVEGNFVGKGGATAAFKQPLNAKRYQINLYDPHSDPYQEITPGPGQYEAPTAAAKSNKPMPAYSQTQTDRFGCQKRRKRTVCDPPGPGAYAQSRENSPLAASAAVFVSESERNWLLADRKPPGPAYYKPQSVPKRKSFHLNTAKRWL